MKKILLLVITLLSAVLVFAGGKMLYDRLTQVYDPQNITVTEEQATLEESSASPTTVKAPDFTVLDANGNEVHLSDFVGKPVVLNFWASWCPPCKSEMPDFEKVYQTCGEDVQFMMVNLTDGNQETVASAKAYIEAQGYTFPIFYDTALDAAMKYGVYSVPMTYFIDANGFAIAKASGEIDEETLKSAIEKVSE